MVKIVNIFHNANIFILSKLWAFCTSLEKKYICTLSLRCSFKFHRIQAVAI